MRTSKLGSLVAAALFASGCFQMTTTVKVNGDGSGTIDHSMLVTKAALAQLRNFASRGGAGRGQAGTVDLISEDQARSMASSLGSGVTYVSSEPIDTPLGQGRRATYAFTDISQIRISQQPEAPAGMRATGRGFGDGEITCSLTRAPNGDSIVHIFVPEMKPPELPIGSPRPPTADGQVNPMMAQQLAMVRALLAGAKVSIAMEPAGRLVKTNSPFVDGSRVTLLDLDLDQLLANETAFSRLQTADTPEAVREALKDVPGLKIPVEREITIEFTPAK
jgi:hypothetical protein